MKHFVSAVLCLFAASSALAGGQPDPEKVKTAIEALPSCQNFVRFDDVYVYLGFGGYRSGFESPRRAEPTTLLLAPLDDAAHPQRLALLDSAIDAVRVGTSLYVLTYSGIEEWDLASRARVAVHPTHSGPESRDFMEHPSSFALHRNELIISHGRLGVSIFDLAEKRVTWEKRLIESQAPKESMATAVVVNGDRAYVALDTFTLAYPGQKDAFSGIVVINLATRQVESELNGMDPGADALATDGQKLIVSFAGIPIWKYALAGLRGRLVPTPEGRIFTFPEPGHPTGRAAMDAKYYYTCFVRSPEMRGDKYKVGLRVWTRQQLKLD